MKRTFPITLALLAWACPLVTERLVAAERDWSFDDLHEEYSRGGFALNLDTHGFLLGVGFHF